MTLVRAGDQLCDNRSRLGFVCVPTERATLKLQIGCTDYMEWMRVTWMLHTTNVYSVHVKVSTDSDEWDIVFCLIIPFPFRNTVYSHHPTNRLTLTYSTIACQHGQHIELNSTFVSNFIVSIYSSRINFETYFIVEMHHFILKC